MQSGVNVNVNVSTGVGTESYFDGGLASLIGNKILGFLVTVCTLGICLPWAIYIT